MQFTRWSVPVALLVLSATLAATTPAQPKFSAAQVGSGQAVYTANCAACHGAKLQGGVGPALMGTAFLKKWADGKKTLAALETYIAQKMPLGKPHSLSATQYLNVTAYVLSKNGYKAGSAALNAAGLKVKLGKPAGK